MAARASACPQDGDEYCQQQQSSMKGLCLCMYAVAADAPHQPHMFSVHSAKERLCNGSYSEDQGKWQPQ